MLMSVLRSLVNKLLQNITRLLGWQLHFTFRHSIEKRRISQFEQPGMTIVAYWRFLRVGSVWVTVGSFYGREANYAKVYSLLVNPAFRRLGAGRALMHEVFKVSRMKGFNEVFLLCKTSNWRALNLYQSMGFDGINNSQLTSSYNNELRLHSGNIQLTGLYLKL